MKICTCCKIEKDKIEFGIDNARKDKLNPYCNLCRKNKYILNKTEAKKRSTKYYIKNSIIIKEKTTRYQKENKERVNKTHAKYIKNRSKYDPLYKLTINIRDLIQTALNGGGFKKDSTTAEYLGCSFVEFKIHIENQFTEGMSWDNHGAWHLDHIYPVSRALNEEHLIRLNHYTNFQPLWAADNIRKGNIIPEDYVDNYPYNDILLPIK